MVSTTKFVKLNKLRSNGSEILYQIFIVTIVAIICITCIYPLIYVTGLSLTTNQELKDSIGKVFLFPLKPVFTAYRAILFGQSIFLNALFISVSRTLVGTVTSLICTVMVGYTLSRKYLPGRKFFIIANLVTILFSGGLIPTYLVIRDLGLYNRFLVFIIPGLVQGWNCLVFQQFFQNIPQDIEEAATIDGASEFNLMSKVIVPMSTPVMAAIGLFTAVGHWNSWFDAAIYIRTANLQPLQLVLQNIMTNPSAVSDMSMQAGLDQLGDTSISSMSLKMAVAVIGTVPILCVYPFLQKYFISGVYSGAVKE
ncbi:MAG: carbohydrate ABC transporter permease [Eubacteriales bacterium]|nr:carbohydrate ABC transporter permease [Eubacteriales bacterium]